MRGTTLDAWAAARGYTAAALVAQLDAGLVSAEVALELREAIGADVRRAA